MPKQNVQSNIDTAKQRGKNSNEFTKISYVLQKHMIKRT